MKPFFGHALIFALVALPATAQDTETPKAFTLNERTINRIRQDPDRFLENQVRALFQMTATGVLSDDVVALMQELASARARGQLLLQILQFDLDGSFAVDAAEIDRISPHVDTNRNLQLQTFLASADTDRDGTLSTDEILTKINDQLSDQALRANDPGLMEFDLDGNGLVSVPEIADVIAGVMAGDIQASKN